MLHHLTGGAKITRFSIALLFAAIMHSAQADLWDLFSLLREFLVIALRHRLAL
jgi:hypothetical protein